MGLAVMRVVFAIFFSLTLTCPLFATEVRGVPRIVDADTVYVGSLKIRLIGIDAPETDQVCIDHLGHNISCGIEARNRLQEFAGDHSWTCNISGTDRYRRNLGTCSVKSEDVSRWLVRSGWALAFRRYSTSYVADEEFARMKQNGLWSGAFIAPWDWRHRNAKTQILGATSVPVDAQLKILSPKVGEEPPNAGCVIKGNLGRSGQCIYHVPGGQFYDRLRMQPTSLRRWFCSETDAEAAGCRRSKL